MKQILTLVTLIYIIVGCTPPPTTYLTGSYQEKTLWIESPRSYDEAFDRTIDILTEANCTPEMIDRPNGIVRFDSYIAHHNIATEKRGAPDDKNKFAVASVSVPAWSIGAKVIVLIRPRGKESNIGVKMILEKSIMGRSLIGQVASLGVFEGYLAEKISK